MRPARTIVALIALIALAASAAAPARNFQPPRAWTASGGVEVERPAAFYANAALHPRDDGSVLWIGNEQGRGGIALRALLRPGQAAAMDQFGDVAAGHVLVVERVLAADAEVALVDLVEDAGSGRRRDVLAAIDLVDGGLRWALPFAADAALRRPDGDALVLAGGNLLRLSPLGAVRWARHLEEFAERSVLQDAVALQSAGERVVVLLSRRLSTPQGETALAPRVLAFDAAGGALAWRADTGGVRACTAAMVGGALVVAAPGASAANGTAGFAVQRFALADGALQASTTVPAVPADDPACTVIDVDGAAVLATVDDTGASTLSAIAADGGLRWRTDLDAGFQPVLARVPGSGDVVHVAVLPGSDVRRVERRRGVDGSLAWSVTRSTPTELGPGTAAVSAQAVHLVANARFPLAPEFAGIEREELSLADGSLLASPDTALSRRELLPYEAQFVDGLPFDAAIGADGGIVVRRRSSTAAGDPLWSRAEPGPASSTATPASITVRGAGPGRLAIVANYRLPGGSEPRRIAVVLVLDRDTGSVAWRRDFGPLADSPVSALDAGSAGVLLSLRSCDQGPPCGSGVPLLRRLSAVDGSTVWERTSPVVLAAFAGEDAIVFEAGTGRNWRLLSAPTGNVAWTQALPSSAVVFELSAAAGSFVAPLGTNSGGVAQVDVERRSLVDGALLSTLRAGLAGDQVATALMRPAVNGMPLLTARVLGPEPGQEGLQRPLVQLLDATGASAQLTLRPTLSGADRWWTLRALASGSGSITRQPLRSLRYLESVNAPYNSRTALAFLDFATATLGGEQLVERRFDDPLRVDFQPELLQVQPDGTILAAESVLTATGLRRRTLMRLGAPADTSGDLRLRLLDADRGATGFGPSRRIRVEVDNLGTTAVADALFGVAPRRDRDPVHAVFAGCSVVAGSASCPADPALRRVSLAPGATLRLEWEMFDAGYRNAAPVGSPVLAGARIFIDSPWGYADTEPGNNVVEVALRLGAFGDDFE